MGYLIFLVIYVAGVCCAWYLNSRITERYYREHPDDRPTGRDRQIADSGNIILVLFSWLAVLALLAGAVCANNDR